MNRTESLLRNISLAGKTVAPFSANGGSGLADTEEILRAKRAKAAD